MTYAQRAVVLFHGDAGERSQTLPSYNTSGAVNHTRGQATPGELILHESIKGLVLEVAELRTRCERLEEQNTQLDGTMQRFEKTLAEAPRAPLTHANLTGYASSESSSDNSSAEGVVRNENIDKKFGVIGEVLERFSARIEAQDKRHAEMATELNGLRTYKERSSALFSALKTELESPVTDQDDDQKQQVAALNDRVQALQDDFRTFQRAHKRFNESYSHRIDTEETIDNASTKEELYRLFKDLEKALWDDDHSGSCGIFRGGEKELMALRNRILRRLALFDPIGDALQEAQKADVDY